MITEFKQEEEAKFNNISHEIEQVLKANQELEQKILELEKKVTERTHDDSTPIKKNNHNVPDDASPNAATKREVHQFEAAVHQQIDSRRKIFDEKEPAVQQIENIGHIPVETRNPDETPKSPIDDTKRMLSKKEPVIKKSPINDLNLRQRRVLDLQEIQKITEFALIRVSDVIKRQEELFNRKPTQISLPINIEKAEALQTNAPESNLFSNNKDAVETERPHPIISEQTQLCKDGDLGAVMLAKAESPKKGTLLNLDDIILEHERKTGIKGFFESSGPITIPKVELKKEVPTRAATNKTTSIQEPEISQQT